VFVPDVRTVSVADDDLAGRHGEVSGYCCASVYAVSSWFAIVRRSDLIDESTARLRWFRKTGIRDRGEDADDDHDHEELDQGEALVLLLHGLADASEHDAPYRSA
jgi:hypothetical protein